MMLRHYSFCLLLLFSLCYAVDLKKSDIVHSNRYDYLHIDKIISNERILERLMDCIMDRGPCTREGRVLKRVIPEALQTDCLNCPERQKVNTGRYLAYLLQYRPEYWDELLNKFDPDGTHRRKFGIDIDSFEEEDSERNADKRQISNLQRAKLTSQANDKKNNVGTQRIRNRTVRDLESHRIKSDLTRDGKVKPTDRTEVDEGAVLKWPIRNIYWKLSRLRIK